MTDKDIITSLSILERQWYIDESNQIAIMK